MRKTGAQFSSRLPPSSLFPRRKSGYELEILSEFSRLCARLFQTAGAVRDQQAVKQMISYLNEQLSEKISLSDIARAGMVCESRCLKLFRLFTGQTPSGIFNSSEL